MKKKRQDAESGSTQNEEAEKERIERARRIWARCDLWPLDSAFELVFNPNPSLPGESSGWEIGASQRRAYDTMREVAMSCAGYSLRIIRTEFRPDVPCVEPEQFLDWADSRKLPVPLDLRLTVTKTRAELKQRGPSRERAFRPEQRHRFRCVGIAAYLWSLPENKTLTIQAMSERPEILQIGCEGVEYLHDTIRDWIKVEAPDRSPGRRPKHQ